MHAGERSRAHNLEVLLGLPVEVSVLLGDTMMAVQDLLRLGPGSIIELRTKVADPLQVYIDDKKIGEGHPVMLQQHFGLRLMSVLSPAERLQHLGP